MEKQILQSHILPVFVAIPDMPTSRLFSKCCHHQMRDEAGVYDPAEGTQFHLQRSSLRWRAHQDAASIHTSDAATIADLVDRS